MGKPLGEVVADLTRETSWRSIAVQVSLKQVRHAAIGEVPAGITTGNREQYTAASSGQRKYGQFALADGREVCLRLGYTDGQRCAAVEFRRPPLEGRQRSITITPGFLDEAETGYAAIPAALPYAVGLVPIRAAIARAEPVGPGRILDRPCTRYYFAGVPGGGTTQDLVYYLDDATSFPLAIDSFANRDRFVADQPTTSWEVIKFDEVQGRHVATDSDYTTFLVAGPGKPTPTLTNYYHVDMIRFDAAIPYAAFWPAYEPGVRVDDRIAGTSIMVKSETPAPTPGRPTAATTVPSAPIGWGTWAGVAVVGVALALLLGGLIRRGWRGKATA